MDILFLLNLPELSVKTEFYQAPSEPGQSGSNKKKKLTHGYDLTPHHKENATGLIQMHRDLRASEHLCDIFEENIALHGNWKNDSF